MNKRASSGVWAAHAVSNIDSQAPYQYFIGTDPFVSGKFYLLRTQGSSIKKQTLHVPNYQQPINVPLKGEMGYYLDSLDERISSAHIRYGRLWCMHSVAVNNVGRSSEHAKVTRNACRWYEFDITQEKPRFVQAGVVYKPTDENTFDKASYWIGDLMTNGQNNMLIGCHKGGVKRHVDCAWSARFDDYGYGKVIRPSRYTTSENDYEPEPSEKELAARVLFMGEKSQTSVDPRTNMSFWTVQPYVHKTNQWTLQAQKFDMPGPPKLKKIFPKSVDSGQRSVELTLQGVRDHRIDIYEDESAFYDPGKGYSNRLRVISSGKIKVLNSRMVSPLEIKVAISTIGVAPGKYHIKIINPDGQSTVKWRGLHVK